MANSIIAEHKFDASPVQEEYTMHTHNLYEILYFVEGDAIYSVEGNIYTLKKGDLILIRKGETHHVIFKSNASYERYVVHFDPNILLASGNFEYIMRLFDERPLGKFNRFKGKNMPANNWLYYFECICKYNYSPDRQKIYMLALLSELSDTVGNDIEKFSSGEENNINEILKYINNNLSSRLSLEEIGEKFFLSKSQINRRFKNTLGTTVWNYIKIKRVYKAREYLLKGLTPNDAAAKSGFADYVTFYKSYKNEFGVSPKIDKIPKTKKSR